MKIKNEKRNSTMPEGVGRMRAGRGLPRADEDIAFPRLLEVKEGRGVSPQTRQVE